MRMSCNGCRVLRKGCNEDCTIRPCLQWIKSPDSQANATLFLAKFYGRAGLINLIAASPRHLRPATFRSLLYEACGRIVSPAYGSAGLLWSGNWARCQAAVEAVLKGSTIITPPTLPSQINVRAAQVVGTPNPKSYDIRHVSKEDPTEKSSLNRIRDRPRFKKSAPPSTLDHLSAPGFLMGFSHRFNQLPGQMDLFEPANINSSGSWLGQKQLGINGDSGSNGNSSSSKEEGKSLFSVETVEGSPMKMAEPDQVSNNISLGGRTQDGKVDLDLTLGLGPIL